MDIFGVRLSKLHVLMMGGIFFQSWVFIFSGAWALGGMGLLWLLQNFLYEDSRQITAKLRQENHNLKEDIGKLLDVLEKVQGVTVTVTKKEKEAA